jgi:hypothetical protein
MIRIAVMVLAVAASISSAGCATSAAQQMHDKFDPRIGHYTYDQAVLEYGPPSQEQTVSNGWKVAVWHKPLSGGSTTTYNAWTNQTYTHNAPTDSALRLTFNQAGVMQTWAWEAR